VTSIKYALHVIDILQQHLGRNGRWCPFNGSIFQLYSIYHTFYTYHSKSPAMDPS